MTFDCLLLKLLGVWVAHEWRAMETDDPLHIIELGPGRGTLASDIIRVCLSK